LEHVPGPGRARKKRGKIGTYAHSAGTFASSRCCRGDFLSAQERHMNWDRVQGNWKQFKGQVQQKWGKLTDDDLDVIEGKRTELAGRLQQRYGYAKDEAEKNIDTWLNNIH
jgi:uncharacterized protein YjbJ (UPF0337 family)